MGQAGGNRVKPVKPVDVRDYLSHDLNITMTDSEIQPWIDHYAETSATPKQIARYIIRRADVQGGQGVGS